MLGTVWGLFSPHLPLLGNNHMREGPRSHFTGEKMEARGHRDLLLGFAWSQPWVSGAGGFWQVLEDLTAEPCPSRMIALFLGFWSGCAGSYPWSSVGSSSQLFPLPTGF